jgi:hypothetical protein
MRAISPWAHCALALALLMAACARPSAPLPPTSPVPILSLLAVGDTGKPPSWPRWLDTESAVGDALAAEDARAPVGALVLLGDNFYPHGLLAGELEARLRSNLVRPFCRFIALTPRAFGSLDCATDERHALPLYAVLGNHDYGSTESTRLQSEAIPQYVANWRLVGQPVERVDLPGGVSLVFFDSSRLRHGGDVAALERELREAPGPWRVLIAHHPLENDPRSAPIRAAIAASGARVQLLLAGHRHSLRFAVGGPGEPALQVVAGSGSRVERPAAPLPGERFVLRALGFARVDLYRERLRVTLYRVWRRPLGARAEPVAAFDVTRDGVASPYSAAGPGN